MSDVLYRIMPLNESHVRDVFHSGEEALDRYIKTQAGQEVRRGYAGVIVAIKHGESVIQGYYTLSASSIELSSLPEKTQKRLPRYGQVPAVLLGRLAVDGTAQGKGLGARLLADALKRACHLLGNLGWAFFVVKAKHEGAANFYRHFGFEAFPNAPLILYLNKNAALHSTGDEPLSE